MLDVAEIPGLSWGVDDELVELKFEAGIYLWLWYLVFYFVSSLDFPILKILDQSCW